MTLTAERIQEISHRAERLLVDSGCQNQLPIATDKIAEHLGYEALGFFPSEITQNVSGVVDHEKKKIAVNKTESARRQHFTIAHEIGHVVLHQGESVVDYRNSIDNPMTQKEVEANRFASELLMPSMFFYEYWTTFKGSIDKMASKFGVSDSAIEIRMRELGLR